MVCADESVNDTAVGDDIDGIQVDDSAEQFGDLISEDNVDQTAVDDELINLSECSSLVLHVSDTESVISFRRDSTDAADLYVVSGKWGDIDFVKQYKTAAGYFCHAIVTSNGWVIGDGGVTDGTTNAQIEGIASEMVAKNEITNSYLSRIYNILSRYSLGHFVIKAPDGTYGVVFTNLYHVGKLNPGEYVLCPNVYSYSKKGSYDSSLNVVDAAIKIISSDTYGINRRNVMTYHYKTVPSAQGLSMGVDVYASNDNGRAAGRSTAGLVDNVYYFGTFHSRSSLPQTPNKVQLGTYIFERTSIQIFKLLTPVGTVLVGDNVDVKYEVHYIAKTNPVVRFEIPTGFELNGVNIAKGTYTYDAAPRVVTWYLNDNDLTNLITLSLKAVKSGKYKMASSLNNNFVYEISLSANDYGAVISAGNVEKYYGGSQGLDVYLKDASNNGIAGEKVKFNINGVDYQRTTNDNGFATMPLKLNSGSYNITVSYNGRFGSDSKGVNVKILKTVSGNDIVKYYRNDTQYIARFIDSSGNPLVRQSVTFNIHGLFYTRTTDGNGFAKMNINLNPGEYIITAMNSASGEFYSNTVEVLPVLVDGHDLTKYYKNDSVYSIKVLDGMGNPLAGADVKFNINGVFYTRQSNESGYANLNIKLEPKDYIVTAEYNSYMYSNIVHVLPVLFANDTVSYSNQSNFTVKLIDGIGNPYPDQNITFNIAGVVYTNVTDENGIASLFINLAEGEHIITSTYDGYSISNKITMKSEELS